MITIRRPRPGALLLSLLAIAACLVILDSVSWLSGVDIGERLSLDAEASLPAWWASFQFALLGATLWLSALRELSANRRAAGRTLAIGAVCALYFGIDESVAIHEGITVALVDKDWIPSFNGEHGVWIFVYGGIALALLVVSRRGLLSLLETDRFNIVAIAAGAVLVVVGGVVVEAVGYSFPSHAGVVIEEALELVGVSVMLWGAYCLVYGTGISFPSDTSGRQDDADRGRPPVAPMTKARRQVRSKTTALIATRIPRLASTTGPQRAERNMRSSSRVVRRSNRITE